MELTDTHAHMCSKSFDPDLEEVLARCREAGVQTVIAVSENLADVEKNLALAQKYPLLKPAAGLYPEFANEKAADRMVAFIRTHHTKLAAIGEVGLDFRLAEENEKKELQKNVFGMFIELSKELDLPLNVHSRSAGRQAVEMLLERDARKVQLHAFDARYGSAIPAVEAGFFFSIPPSVVRSRQKQKLVKLLPLSCLLAETDSPVLGPEPGARNEPANLPLVIEAIAGIKGLDPEEVKQAVIENTARLYGSFQFLKDRYQITE